MINHKRTILALLALAIPLLGLFALVQGLPAADQPGSTTASTRYYVNAARDDGLVAYWRFDETSGFGTSDVSKTQAHGTLSGNATFVSDLPGAITFPNHRALSLDGSGDYVDTKDFDLTDDFTIALWVSPQSADARNMIGKHDSGGGNLLLFGMYRDSYHVRIRDQSFDSTRPVSPGWHHIAITGEKTGANSTLIRLYRNGVEIQVETLDAVVGNISGGKAWTIGQDWDGASRTDYYKGLLDDIRIYNRVLPADEISQMGYFGNDNDGKSWADAYSTLERALGVATNDDEIWVASGVYTPTRLATTHPIEPRSATFRLGIGVAHYGGFSGSETSLSQRQPGTHVTVLSGDVEGNDLTNGQGVVEDTADIVGDNVFHVVSSLSVGDSITTLDGFTITAGKARNGVAFSDSSGGGIYHYTGSPMLSNLLIQGNDADHGGGMYAIIGQPSLSLIRFEGNTAQDGGGLYSNQATPHLNDVIFQSNRTDNTGGGMYAIMGGANLIRVTFSDNYAVVSGGGLATFNSEPILSATTLSENKSGYGGAIYSGQSNVQIMNSTVISNEATGFGGGLFKSDSDLQLNGTTFKGNNAYHGGGMHIQSGTQRIQRSTFIGNSATTNGGGIAFDGNSFPRLSRVTFSGNAAGGKGGGIHIIGGDIDIFNAYFDTNSSGAGGGGAFFESSATHAGNVVFLANSSTYEGGGFVNSDGPMQTSNVTIAYNSAGTVGGGAFISGLGSDGSLLANSILWGNQADVTGPELFVTGGFAITETFNLISGTAGVLPTSPFQIDPDPGPDGDWATADDNLGDLRPQEISQATDTGSNDHILQDIIDLDGDANMVETLPVDLQDNPRVYNGTVDIGAYEWNRFFIYVPFVKK